MTALTPRERFRRAPESLLLYAVSDDAWLGERTLASCCAQAVRGGATFLQLRAKRATTEELISAYAEIRDELEREGLAGKVPFVIDDDVEAALAVGADGVHVGQTDIPVEACRVLLGHDAVVGLSARADEMLEYVKTADMSLVDYLGVGPLHETPTKTDCGLAADGTIITKSLEDLAALHQASPVPIVVGGGVKVADIPAVAQTGVDGFFVVSAVCAAPDPHAAAQELVQAWNAAKQAS